MTQPEHPETAQKDEKTPGMTIDQIAQHAAIPTSTVRLYQNKGLISPPERRGRVGYYNTGHQVRLQVIAHLQERGFSLAAIKEVIDSWTAGHSLEHLLGVTNLVPMLTREPLRLSPSELAERFAGVGLTQENVQRAVDIGLAELDGPDVVISNKAFADIGPAVAELGVPVEEILDEYEALRQAVDGIASRFQAVFEKHLWKPFESQGMPVDKIPTLAADIAQLANLATSVVTTELHDRFSAFAAEYISQAESKEDGE